MARLRKTCRLFEIGSFPQRPFIQASLLSNPSLDECYLIKILFLRFNQLASNLQ